MNEGYVSEGFVSLGRTDRARGALIGTAAGDALGAGYEFTTPAPDEQIVIKGGGPFGFEAGEWTDDTAMAAAIARAAARHRLDTTEGLDAVAAGFQDWYASGPKDIGGQTRRVLSAGATTASAMRAAAEATGPCNAGNGSLMRTAAVAAAFSGDADPTPTLAAADQISRLTHTGEDTHFACQAWSHAVWAAIRTGALPDLHGTVDALFPASAHGRWHAWVTAAETQERPVFEHDNGWVVSALQTAWWAIHHADATARAPTQMVRRSLIEAVRAGHDTDTTAAIAGGLVGAVHGAGAIPAEWTRVLRGWPGIDADGLARLADAHV